MKKEAFILPHDQHYFCGHSLGPMPIAAKKSVDQTLTAWEKDAVLGWTNDAWIDLPHHVSEKLAPLLGAQKTEVMVGDSTSVHLFKALMSALNLNPERHVILTTDDNFPTDNYIAHGITAFKPNITINAVKPETLLSEMDERVAVLLLTHVNYRDAHAFDLHEITKIAHQKNIITVWDLSHSVGIMPLHLHEVGADFAVGCTYKYLNGGPGAPSFIYAHERHLTHLISPIQGWMGHQRPFAFDADYESHGIAQYLSGTPYLLSLRALAGALDVFDGVSLDTLHQQSLEYSTILIQALRDMGMDVVTSETHSRGGHVAFMHPQGYALSRALIERGIIVDYRAPDLIRICVNPLYLSLGDIHDCLSQLRLLILNQTYLAHSYQKKVAVT